MNLFFANPTRVDFTVAGNPEGQPRHTPRAFARFDPAKGRVVAGVRMIAPTGSHDSKKSYLRRWARVHDWEESIERQARPFVPASPWDGPVVLKVTAYFERPASLLKRSSPRGRIPHTVKPDEDNISKLVKDVFTRMGFWVDDSRVFSGTCRKFYCAIGAGPGIRVRAWLLEDGR